jgi:hypothetical protein
VAARLPWRQAPPPVIDDRHLAGPTPAYRKMAALAPHQMGPHLRDAGNALAASERLHAPPARRQRFGPHDPGLGSRTLGSHRPMLPAHPQPPGQRDLLRVNFPPGESARRSVDRMADHYPSAGKLDNFAPAHLPQQPSLTEVHQRITATTE